MDAVVLVLSAGLSVGFLGWFVWHLSWPVVEGAVVSNNVIDVPSVAVSNRRRRHVVYQFSFSGRDCTTDRQALFWRYGLAPDLPAGGKVLIKVCPINVRWSCPRRVLFNTLGLLGFQLFFALAIFLALT